MKSYIILSDELLNNNNICINAKLLYSRIVLLSHDKGYCFASNKYLGDILGVTSRTISRLLKELKDNDLIYIKYTSEQQRYIYIKT